VKTGRYNRLSLFKINAVRLTSLSVKREFHDWELSEEITATLSVWKRHTLPGKTNPGVPQYISVPSRLLSRDKRFSGGICDCSEER
jgi:hypothetical protein